MLIFIDESGDAGFKVEKCSSPIFVIACLIFDDDLEVEKSAVAIKELRRKLDFSDRVEFKFNGSRKEVRIKFLKRIKDFNFRVRALVVRKDLIRSDQLKNDKNSFYSYFIKMVLKHNRGTIRNAKIRIDGSGNRVFRKNFLTYLRKELNSKDKRVMKNMQMVDSKNNVMI